MIVSTTTGRRWALGLLLPYCRLLTCRLFVNDTWPSATTARTDLVEASGYWYAGIPLNAWGSVYIRANLCAATDHPRVEWDTDSRGGAPAIYGYFLTDPTNSVLFAERDPAAPISLLSPGSKYKLTPRLLCGMLGFQLVSPYSGGQGKGGNPWHL